MRMSAWSRIDFTCLHQLLYRNIVLHLNNTAQVLGLFYIFTMPWEKYLCVAVVVSEFLGHFSYRSFISLKNI